MKVREGERRGGEGRRGKERGGRREREKSQASHLPLL